MFGINKNLNVHFIGIGGIGMSGIAEVLLELGYNVSGSDVAESATVEKLKSIGAKIYLGHKKENVKDVQIIVYSSAIDTTNPEIQEAKTLNLPIIKRAQMLAELMRLKKGIAVAGSHGKTTTTSFLATILKKLNYQPTYIIGGVVKNLGGHAKIGESEILVAEADESDGSFLFLNPIMSVVTNIDNDHLDYYHTVENLKEAFVQFVNKIPFYGILALNAHDKTTSELLSRVNRPYKVFGIEDEIKYINKVDYLASSVEHTEEGMKFILSFEQEKEEFEIRLSGNHNVLNAIGAIIVAHQLGSSFKEIAKVIYEFQGVSRRLETLYQNENLIIIDDYAHHPTEITATINTLKTKYPQKKLVVIFEPHRFSRTKNFWNDFVGAFNKADQLYVSPIYAASEAPIEYIDSEILVKNINEHKNHAQYINSLEEIEKIITFNKNEKRDTLILTIGAGPISKTVRAILNE